MATLASLLIPDSRALTAKQWLVKALGGAESYTGRQVGYGDALVYTPVWRCLTLISFGLASLPIITYRRLPEGGKERARNHPLYSLLHDSPNPEMTAFEYWQATIGHVETRGNAYAEIERDNGERIRALWPLRPDRMRVTRNPDDRSLTYVYQLPDGREVGLPAYRVLHLRNFSGDGLVGYSTIQAFRETVALGLSLEEYHARFFGNNASPSGVLSYKGTLSEAGQKNLKKSWEDAHRGLSNAHRVAVLEDGVTWQQIGISNQDAQFLDSRRFQVEEVARIFGVPPHMLQALDRATFNNIEHMSWEYYAHTLAPRAVNIQQRLLLSLFSTTEGKRSHFPEFLLLAIQRADSKARAEFYASGILNGWLKRNEVREIENLNAEPGLDEPLMPLNMVPVSQVGQEPAGAAGQPTADQVDRWLVRNGHGGA